jgi:hypothetical protein
MSRPARAPRVPPAGSRERGQASVETLGASVAVLVTALIGFQLLAAGYAAVMAGHAAEGAAIALANGRDPARGALDAVPGWPRHALEVERHGDRVKVTLAPPSPLRLLRDRLSVSAESEVRAARAGPP